MLKRMNLFMVVLGLFLLMAQSVTNSIASTVNLSQTGQTSCWDTDGNVIPCTGTGQDGDKLAGGTWPNPRFTDDGDGTITDNLTGLVWLKNAGCFSCETWAAALESSNNLGSGQCGLMDGSQAGDWRLPNFEELKSLVNHQQSDPATWLNSQGFTDVQYAYWSSTTVDFATSAVYGVFMYNGTGFSYNKTNPSGFWPVRGGQVVNLVNLVVSTDGTGPGTVTSYPPGISCGDGGTGCSARFAKNSNVLLIATAPVGVMFSGWSGCDSLTNGCTVNMAAPASVTATFTLMTVTLNVYKAGTGSSIGTVTSSPIGISCGSDCSAQFLLDTQVVLTASAPSGTTFQGWSGCTYSEGYSDNSSPTCNVTMSTGKNVTATFTQP
ncbi:MAG: DUF1566 domain-containing protein [Nitrospirae bacterium]|nr:DUF1566 domain-containing protein [Nitrospirota bacterium]